MAVSDTSPNIDNGFIGVGIVYWKGSADTFWRDMGEVPKFDWTPKITPLEWKSHRSGIRKLLKTFVVEQTSSIGITLQEGTAKNWCLALMGTETAAVSFTSATLVTTIGSTAITGLTPTSALVSNRRYNVSGTGIPAGDTLVYNGGTTATLDAPATAAGTITASGTITSLGVQSAKVFAQSQINGSLMFVGKNDVGAPIIAEFRQVTISPSATLALIQDGVMGDMQLMAEVFQDTGGDFGHFDWNTSTSFAPYTGP